jgi:HAD superfamily hydrolase (TIGR01549 family)
LDYLSVEYPLHIITNGFANIQDQKLAHSGLRPYFDVIVTPDTTGEKKPHPSIFEAALAAAGCAPAQAMLVGDSYPEDIIGGSNLGMQVVYYNPKGKENPDGHPEIGDLWDLVHLLSGV